MKIVRIKPVGKRPVYDLSVKDAEHYVLKNGVVTHNTGIYYCSDNIWIIGRQQDKKGTEIIGYNFVIKVEKSRYVREGSKIPISVSWEGGILKWSGLLDVALEGGYVYKPSQGWYMGRDPETGADLFEKKCQIKDTNTKEFWETIFKKTDFYDYIKNRYTIGYRALIEDDDIPEAPEEEDENVLEEENSEV